MPRGQKRHHGHTEGTELDHCTTVVSLSKVLRPGHRDRVVEILDKLVLYASKMRLIIALVVKEHVRMDMAAQVPDGQLSFTPTHDYFMSVYTLLTKGALSRRASGPLPYEANLRAAIEAVRRDLPVLPLEHHSGISDTGIRSVMNPMMQELSVNLLVNVQMRAYQLLANWLTNHLLALLSDQQFADLPGRKTFLRERQLQVSKHSMTNTDPKYCCTNYYFTLYFVLYRQHYSFQLSSTTPISFRS